MNAFGNFCFLLNFFISMSIFLLFAINNDSLIGVIIIGIVVITSNVFGLFEFDVVEQNE